MNSLSQIRGKYFSSCCYNSSSSCHSSVSSNSSSGYHSSVSNSLDWNTM